MAEDRKALDAGASITAIWEALSKNGLVSIQRRAFSNEVRARREGARGSGDGGEAGDRTALFSGKRGGKRSGDAGDRTAAFSGNRGGERGGEAGRGGQAEAARDQAGHPQAVQKF